MHVQKQTMQSTVSIEYWKNEQTKIHTSEEKHCRNAFKMNSKTHLIWFSFLGNFRIHLDNLTWDLDWIFGNDSENVTPALIGNWYMPVLNDEDDGDNT